MIYKQNFNHKLKPAKRYVSKEKVGEVTEKTDEGSLHITTADDSDSNQLAEVQSEAADINNSECQQGSEPPEISHNDEVVNEPRMIPLSEISYNDFCTRLETAFITALRIHAETIQKEKEESIRQQEAEGVEVITPENALTKCVSFINAIKNDFNLYKAQKNAVAKEQALILETTKHLADNTKRLETVVGRIERVQGVKVPKRPPFPSWECLAYLFWHWPMYAFAFLWQSKYFRRFCFLLALFVMIAEFCVIVLLAGDNKTMHYAVSKYNTVRNWSLVEDDTSAMDRFNKVDQLFEDPEFNSEEIIGLRDTIKSKHERLMEKRRKEIERGHRR